MKTKIIFAAIGGLVVGAAGGFVGGMYYSDRKNSEEKAREINEVKQSYAQKYASDLKSEANRIAKEIIFRAQKDVSMGADGDAGTPAEELDNPSGDDNSEDNSSGDDDSKPAGEKPEFTPLLYQELLSRILYSSPRQKMKSSFVIPANSAQ